MLPNLQLPEDLVTFTEEILNWKFHVQCINNFGLNILSEMSRSK